VDGENKVRIVKPSYSEIWLSVTLGRR